jgi:hypothetical protein
MPNQNDRRRQVGRPRSVVNRSAGSRLRQTATTDAAYSGADLPGPKDNLASLKDIDREEQVLIVRTLVRALAIIDHFDPVRNPASSMRQLRTLFASARLRAALRRLNSE